MHFAGISGSLRTRSYNTALLREVETLLAPEHTLEILDISTLPLFNQDLEERAFPESATTLKEKIRVADGVIIATPEFNRTPPGPLKNALDWSARPEGDNPWIGKPVAIFGASSGPRGASFAQYDVRRILAYFDARVLNQPEVYVGTVASKFDESGNVTDEKTRDVLKKFITRFALYARGAQTS